MRELSIGVLEDLAPVLRPKQVEKLCALGVTYEYRRGDVIYRQGEPAKHVYFLLEGEAQSTLLNSSGSETLLRIHLPGSILGLTSLASVPWRDASARAIQHSKLVCIAKDDLTELIRRDPNLALNLIRLLVDRMRDFHFRVADLQFQTVEQRLARVLLAVSRRTNEHKAEIGLTHEELAQLVNSRRQTVTTILGRFARAGYLSKSGRRLIIEDAQSLRSKILGNRIGSLHP
jgi:CRP-like cAMP-binding protein